MKDFYTMAEFSEREVCAGDFMGRFAGICRTAAPLLAFLTSGLGLPW